MLRQGLLGTFLAFGERYCLSDAAANARAGGGGGGGGSPYGGGAIYPGMEFRGARNLLELRELLSTTVMVRRTKAEVGTQLPDKIRKAVPIPIDPDHVETLAVRNFRIAHAPAPCIVSCASCCPAVGSHWARKAIVYLET